MFSYIYKHHPFISSFSSLLFVVLLLDVSMRPCHTEPCPGKSLNCFCCLGSSIITNIFPRPEKDLGNTYLSKKIEKYFQFSTHTLRRILRDHFGIFSSISFEIVKCCLMLKFGVMCGQIFHCFYALLRNIWERQIQHPRNILMFNEQFSI